MVTTERVAWAVAALHAHGITVTTTDRADAYLDVWVIDTPLTMWQTQVEIARDFRAMHVPIFLRGHPAT